MKSISAILAVVLVAAAPALAGDKTEFLDKGKAHFEAPIPSGARLRLHVCSGDVRILGSDDAKISVDVSRTKSSDIENVNYRLKNLDGISDFHLKGGPLSDFNVTIHIPRTSELYLRVPAGDVTVEDVIGSKDIELHAGDLTIQVGNAADYARVDVSVNAGDIDGSPFGESHGGLFRSFRKTGPGKFTLHAHVGAGDLTLR
jgi:hypothetical protein